MENIKGKFKKDLKEDKEEHQNLKEKDEVFAVHKRHDLFRLYIRQLKKIYGYAFLIAIALTFIAWLFNGNFELKDSLIISSIIIIPFGILLVLYIAIRLDTKRAIKSSSNISKLKSILPFGSIDTLFIHDSWLRKEELKVSSIWVDGKLLNASQKHDGKMFPALQQLFKISLLCSGLDEKEEKAEIEAAKHFGYDKSKISSLYPKVLDYKGDPRLKSQVNLFYRERFLLTKGNADLVLSLCNRIFKDGDVTPLTRREHEKIMNSIKELQQNGLTVYGYCYKKLDSEEPRESAMVFTGLQSFAGLSKDHVSKLLNEINRVGVRPIIFTELPAEKAYALARDINLSQRYLSAEKIKEIPDSSLAHSLRGIVLVQAGDDEKKRIASALKSAGKSIGVLGSSIYDLEIIEEADASVIASPSDVKGVDAVLANKTIATVLTLIAAGRTLSIHLKKMISYISTCYLAEILFFLIALFAGFGIPFAVAQILFLHLVVQVLPSLSYLMEPSEENVMEYSLRQRKEIFSESERRRVIFFAIFIAVISSLVTLWFKGSSGLLTMSFAGIFFFEIFHILNARSSRISFFKTGVLRNKWLISAIGINIILALLMFYTDLNLRFGLSEINAFDLGITAIAGSSVFIVAEIWKLVTENQD